MRKIASGVAVAAVLAVAGVAGAQVNYTWVGGTGTNWSVAANWTDPGLTGGVPGAADTATFEAVPAAGLTVTIDAPTSVSAINVDGAITTTPALTLAGADTLTVGSLVDIATMHHVIFQCNLAGGGAIGAVLNSTAGTRYVQIAGGNSMTGGLSVTGQSAATDYLRLDAAGSGGSGTLTLSNAYLDVRDAGALNNVTGMTFGAGGEFRQQAVLGAVFSRNMTFDGGKYNFVLTSTDYTGTMTVASSVTLSNAVQSGNTINKLAGSITGPGQVIVNSPINVNGVALTTANTFRGGLTLDAGQCFVAVDGALGSGNGPSSDQPGPVVVNEGQTYDYYGEHYTYAGLTFVAPQTKAPVSMTVNANGLLRFINDGVSSPTVYNMPFTLKDGGMLAGPGTQGKYTYDAYENNGPVTLAGEITVNNGAKIFLGAYAGSSTVVQAGELLITGAISGGGPLVLSSIHKDSVLALNPAAPGGNTFAGPVTVNSGVLRLDKARAAGTGALTADGSGGTILTNAPDSLAASSAVTIDTGGILNIGSTEGVGTQSAAYVQVKPNAKLTKSAGSTQFNWDWTTPVAGKLTMRLHNGAIIDSTITGITHLDNSIDNVFGVWLGQNASATVGNGPGNVGIRGIAALTSWTYNKTVDENAGNTVGCNNDGSLATIAPNPGPLFYSGPGALVTFDGATVTAQATHKIQLTGPGNYMIDKVANNFNSASSAPIDMRGTGMLQVDDANGLKGAQADGTINMYSGWLDVDHGAALAGGTVNLIANTGTLFSVDAAVSAGTINVGAGTSVCQASDHHDYLLGAATWNWSKGSQVTSTSSLYIYGTDAHRYSAGAGMADYVVQAGGSSTVREDLVLGQDNRLMHCGASITSGTSSFLGRNGTIRLATKAELDEWYGGDNPAPTSATIAIAPGTLNISYGGTIRFGQGTLVLGDDPGPAPDYTPATFPIVLLGGGTQEVASTGALYSVINYYYAGGSPTKGPGTGNTFEKLDIKSGKFSMRNTTNATWTADYGIYGGDDQVWKVYIGTANEIRIGPGAELEQQADSNGSNQYLSSIITGGGPAGHEGLIDMDNSRLILQPGNVNHATTLAGVNGQFVGVYMRDPVNVDLQFQAAGIKPGTGVGGVGIIKTENLGFETDGADHYPVIEIDVIGGNETPGVDHDQVSIVGNVTGLDTVDLTVKFADSLIGTNVLNGDRLVMLVATGTNFTAGDYGSEGILKPTEEPASWVYLFHSVTWTGGTGKIQVDPANLREILLTNLVTRIPGDADLNGYVDLPDLIALARNWKVTPATWGQGDFDGDNIVDLPDLIILARNWHAGTPPPAGGAVPEPASLALLAVGGVVLFRRRAKS